MRPKKTRWINCDPQGRCFKPQGKLSKQAEIIVGLDEFEAMRLIDLEDLSQLKVAKQMRVHRSTVSRLLSSGHKKVLAALVERKILKIEGGCCKIMGGNNEK